MGRGGLVRQPRPGSGDEIGSERGVRRDQREVIALVIEAVFDRLTVGAAHSAWARPVGSPWSKIRSSLAQWRRRAAPIISAGAAGVRSRKSSIEAKAGGSGGVLAVIRESCPRLRSGWSHLFQRKQGAPATR